MSQHAHQMMTSRPSFKRPHALFLAATAGLAASLAGAAGPQSGVSDLKQVEQAGNRPISNQKNAPTSEVVSGRLIVHVNSASDIHSAIEQLKSQFPNLELKRVLSSELGVYLVDARDAAGAIEASQVLMSMPGVRKVQLERTPDMTRQQLISQLAGSRVHPQAARTTQNNFDRWPGITPLPEGFQDPRGGLAVEPLFNSQWHFINNVNTDRDNNIPATVYTTDGLSGMGVQIGLSNIGRNTHIDLDHTELDGNFDPDLTMPFDPNLFPDSAIMTSIAGIASAELDGVGVQGVAPNSTFGNFDWPLGVGGFPLIEYEAFDWLKRDLDIKVFDMFLNYDDTLSSYNQGAIDAYATIPLRNSYNFGRGRKGLVNIFSTGINSTLGLTGLPKWPDPYNFPPAMPGDSWSPLDEIFNSGNEVSITLTNAYTSGPFYPNGQITNYPPANDRRSFVFQTVAEDGFADIYSAFGSSIFASFYGGTTNQFESGSQATSGLGVLTATPGASNVAFFPASTDTFPNGSETVTGATIGAGVIALMLEANPNLSIRDIQHILFESIQESTKPANVKWPNFDINRPYIGPTGNVPPALYSFWQVNAGLYTGGPVTDQAIRHSDIYGFGVVDADIAIQKAASWTGTDRLILLDTGYVGQFSDPFIDNGEVNITIPDATFVVGQEPDGTLGIDGAASVATTPQTYPVICVRQNILIEAIVLELTVEGVGNEDLYIGITGPRGTSSALKMPATNNFVGTSFDEDGTDDNGDGAGGTNVGGTTYALYRHAFLTWKHWGELSGGNWNFGILDYGPDDENPEGEEAGTGPMPDPGADMVIDLGQFGLPGSNFRDEKVLTGYRLQIYGTDIGEPIFEGCAPGATSCPADLNGDGIIDTLDLQIFLDWFLTGNALADLDGDGVLTYSDVTFYRGIWQPGFCNGNDNGISGGRPNPGTSDAGGDNNPDTRPI